MNSTHNQPFKVQLQKKLQTGVIMAQGWQSIWLRVSVELGVGAGWILTAVLDQMRCCFHINRDYVAKNHLFDTD